MFEAMSSGLPDPCWDFRIWKALEAWAMSVVKHQDKRLPMSPGMLQQLVEILPLLCCSPIEPALYKAAFLISFFRALRVGELVFASRMDTSGQALRT